MKNKFFLIFMFIMLFPTAVSAEGIQFITEPGQNQTLFFECQQNNNYIPANASYSIFYPNTSSFINNQALNSYAVGKYSDLVTIPNVEGVYNVELFCDYTNASGYSTGVFQVKNTGTIIEVALDLIFGSFLIFLLGILLFWLGAYSKNVFFFFASSLWFTGSAVAISFNEVNIPMTGFFLLISVVALYHGIGQVYRNKREIKNDKMRRMRDE